MKKVVLLGATGSIGTNTLKVLDELKGSIELLAVAGGANAEALAPVVQKYSCKYAAVADKSKCEELAELCPDCTVTGGYKAVDVLAALPDADIVVCAIPGAAALKPSLEALKAGKTLALASKEVLVMAGELILQVAEKHGGKILPLDSEHAGLFQCLEGRKLEDVHRVVLTGSGGPFHRDKEVDFGKVTVEQALAHPKWKMGPKVTIDSATLMNKVLERIEACALFGFRPEQVEVVIHPEAVIHAIVEFNDGVMLAQMSEPDMRLPIQYALCAPERINNQVDRLDLVKLGSLNFQAPDAERFPSLALGEKALTMGGTMPAVLNAANEVAVEAFLNGEISFDSIFRVTEMTMKRHNNIAADSLETILEVDSRARAVALEIIETF